METQSESSRFLRGDRKNIPDGVFSSQQVVTLAAGEVKNVGIWIHLGIFVFLNEDIVDKIV